MKTFNDNAARNWTVQVNVDAIKRVRDLAQVNLLEVVEGKLLPWLYGIATNVLRNRRRALRRQRDLTRQLARQPRVEDAPDAPARAEAAAQMRSVLTRIARLPRAQQDVVALCIWSGLGYEEAAAALGVPVGTVRSRLARARAALTELDGEPGHTEVELELARSAER